MAAFAADRNLLFGLIAFQNGLIDREEAEGHAFSLRAD